MKNIKLFYILIFCNILFTYGQTTVYVTFTSTESEVRGVWNYEGEIYNHVRDIPHFFTFFDRAGGDREQSFYYHFIYSNDKSNVDTPILVKPKKMLDSLTLIDWDLVKGKSDAETKWKYIISHDKIYFIDKNESTKDTIKLYPVKRDIPKY